MDLLRACLWSLCLLPGLVAAAEGTSGQKLMVMELQPGADVTPEIAAGLTEAVAAAAASSGHYTVISSRELQALLGLERQRQLVGCSDNACMTEIGSAMGARYLLRGSVGRLGTSFQLALQLVDTQRAETLTRSTRLAPSIEQLRERLPYAVAVATGLPPPPPPSRIPAVSSLAGGSLLVVAGAVLGGLALSEDAALSREQSLAVPGSAGTRASYADAQTRLGLQKTGGLVGAIAGAGLIGLGFLLWAPDHSSEGIAFRVGPSSVGIAGVFP